MAAHSRTRLHNPNIPAAPLSSVMVGAALAWPKRLPSNAYCCISLYKLAYSHGLLAYSSPASSLHHHDVSCVPLASACLAHIPHTLEHILHVPLASVSYVLSFISASFSQLWGEWEAHVVYGTLAVGWSLAGGSAHRTAGNLQGKVVVQQMCTECRHMVQAD